MTEPATPRGAVDPSRIEAIVHDWTCGCGKGQACPQRDGCREAAEQIVTELADHPMRVVTSDEGTSYYVPSDQDEPGDRADHEADGEAGAEHEA